MRTDEEAPVPAVVEVGAWYEDRRPARGAGLFEVLAADAWLLTVRDDRSWEERRVNRGHFEATMTRVKAPVTRRKRRP